MTYDENDAIRYIRGHVPAHIPHYDDDELLNVIDIIWDFYERNGMLEIDMDDAEEDESPDRLLEDITDYATRMISRDKGAHIDPAHLNDIIKAEIEYEQSINDDLFSL